MSADLVLSAGATVLGTVGTMISSNDASVAMKAEGENAREIGRWQSAQLKQQAGQERASAQKQAIEERRKGELAISRARALAAASGGGATDPTMLKIYSDLASEGEYNAQAVLQEGEESARGLEAQANAAEYEGGAAYTGAKYRSRAARRSGYISAVGNLLEGGSDFYGKYSYDRDRAKSEVAPPSDAYVGGRKSLSTSRLVFGE